MFEEVLTNLYDPLCATRVALLSRAVGRDGCDVTRRWIGKQEQASNAGMIDFQNIM